jgi:putative acetyltransferase
LEFRVLTPDDTGAAERLFYRVFTESDGETEGNLVGKLARDMMSADTDADGIGFVATDGEEIIGAIFFSRLTYPTDLDVFILSPVAVQTERQGQGVGQALIRHGLEAMQKRGVQFVTTYGDPAFYSRVGFHPVSPHAIEPPYPLSQPEGWLGQNLGDQSIDAIPGRCSCVAPLADPTYW